MVTRVFLCCWASVSRALEKLHGGCLVSEPGQEKEARWGVRLVSSALKLKGKPPPGDVG